MYLCFASNVRISDFTWRHVLLLSPKYWYFLLNQMLPLDVEKQVAGFECDEFPLKTSKLG